MRPPVAPPTAAPLRRAHDGTGRYQRSDAGNSQRADAREQAQGTTDAHAGESAGRRALGGFGVLLMGKVSCACLVRKKNRDISRRKTGAPEAG